MSILVDRILRNIHLRKMVGIKRKPLIYKLNKNLSVIKWHILPRIAVRKIESNKMLEMFFLRIFPKPIIFTSIYLWACLTVYSKLFSNLRENKFEFKKEIGVVTMMHT